MKNLHVTNAFVLTALVAVGCFFLFSSAITEESSDHELIVQLAADLANTNEELAALKTACNETAVSNDPFIGEIIMFAGNFAPRGWAFCQGQLLPINQYQALFSILGTTYGGDGRYTFGLPDLRGRVPVHPGQGPGLQDHRLGSKFGTENTYLRAQVVTVDAAESESGKGTKVVSAIPESITCMQPSLGINFIIALQGTFPSRS